LFGKYSLVGEIINTENRRIDVFRLFFCPEKRSHIFPMLQLWAKKYQDIRALPDVDQDLNKLEIADLNVHIWLLLDVVMIVQHLPEEERTSVARKLSTGLPEELMPTLEVYLTFSKLRVKELLLELREREREIRS
jgi:hypothetical protein